MVVPGCPVTRLITDGSTVPRRVVAVDTNQGQIPVPEAAPSSSPSGRSRARGYAHLVPRRDKYRIEPRRAPPLEPHDPYSANGDRIAQPDGEGVLQVSALFVKGRHDHADHVFAHFHLQITAAGLALQPSTNSEAELFKAIPDFDTIESFRHITDSHVVLTIRGIRARCDRATQRRRSAWRSRTTSTSCRGHGSRWSRSRPTSSFWHAMDAASDQVARAFACGGPFEVLASDDRTSIPATAATDLRPIRAVPTEGAGRPSRRARDDPP